MKDEKQIKTEVTSLAKEEEKTGKKIELPSEEELIAKASASFFASRTACSKVFKSLSSKQKCRVFDAVLDLPTDGVPVLLKSDEEKKAFVYGQRSLSDRFLITYYHILEERRKQIEKLKKESKKKSKKLKGEKNVEQKIS